MALVVMVEGLMQLPQENSGFKGPCVNSCKGEEWRGEKVKKECRKEGRNGCDSYCMTTRD